MNKKKMGKTGRNTKLAPAMYRYTVRFNGEEHDRFLPMFEKSGVYVKSVFLKAHFFGQPFKVLTVDKSLVDYNRIKEEVKQIVRDGLERITNDNSLKHLLQL